MERNHCVWRLLGVAGAATVMALGTGALAQPATAPLTVDAISKIARDFCARPDLYGYERKLEGEVQGHLDPAKILSKMVKAGVSAKVGGDISDWGGIAQRDALAALKDRDACGIKMFSIMFEQFYVRAPPVRTGPTTARKTGASKAGQTVPNPAAPATTPGHGADKPFGLSPEDVLKIARSHRDDADKLSIALNKMTKPNELDGIYVDFRAWDQSSADMVGDFLGYETRKIYIDAGAQQLAWLRDPVPPAATPVSTGPQASTSGLDHNEAARRTLLALIEIKQAALGDLFARYWDQARR